MTIVNRALILVLVLAPVAALADDNVGAEALFREGRRLMQSHDYPAACEKLAASERLARSIGTLLNLGDCREKTGQIATAWETFLEAASTARASGDSAREAEAHRRASLLEPRLAYLTISVPDSSKVEGLVIERGDEQIDPALWNQGVPVDVGTYSISGQAPGHEPWSTTVQITADGQRASVEVPRFKQIADLRPHADARPAAALADPDAGDAHAAPQPRDTGAPVRHRTLSPARDAAIAAAVVGLGGIGAGIWYGLQAKSLERDSDAICPAAACNDSHALDLNQRARHDALASDIALGAGGAIVAGAVVLWFVGAPRAAREHVTVAPQLRAGGAGLAISGAF